MKKNLLPVIAFLLCLAIPLAAVIVSPKKTYSYNENRYLKAIPEATLGGLLSGTFQSDLEEGLSDQFPGRDVFVAACTVMSKASLRRDVGGVYLCKDGYYMEMHTPESVGKEKFIKNLGYLETVRKTVPSVPTTLMLVPCASSVLSDKLPPFARSYDASEYTALAEETLEDVAVADVLPALSAVADESPFFRTDHHWTAFGALAAYKSYTGGAGAYGGAPELFCGGFYGTTYSRTLDPCAEPDDVYIFPVARGVKAVADGAEIPVYDLSAADVKDKYTVFLGGNHGVVTLTGGAVNGKTIVVVKDSFANSFAPLLTSDYGTVVLVDPRYFSGSFTALLKSLDPDELLFLYEISSFASSDDLVKILM